ncbi:hypothetical protein GCM10007978_07670 [Shewanella hanedai]|nr:hypothetical protein GCM10007978_07670 [Shewanella hanedai]
MSDVNVVFICSGNEVTGFGHVSRCLNIASGLARLLPAKQIHFYGDYGHFSKQKIAQAGFTRVEGLPAENLTDTLLIIDDYQITETSLKGYCNRGARLVIIDDFDQFAFECVDLIINFRFEAEKICQPTDKHLLGLDYLPVAPSFEQLRKQRLNNRSDNDIKSVLVFIGGTDRMNFAPTLLSCLDKVLHSKQIIWLTNQDVRLSLRNNQLTQVPYVDDMAELYSSVDLVFSGGGLSKYEAGFCLLPNAAVSQTELQQDDTYVLAENALSFDLGLIGEVDEEELIRRLTVFLTPDVIEQQREAMVNAYRSDSTAKLAEKIFYLL